MFTRNSHRRTNPSTAQVQALCVKHTSGSVTVCIALSHKSIPSKDHQRSQWRRRTTPRVHTINSTSKQPGTKRIRPRLCNQGSHHTRLASLVARSTTTSNHLRSRKTSIHIILIIQLTYICRNAQYLCLHLQCASAGTRFARYADLQRHIAIVHDRPNLQLVDCSYQGCHRRGEYGFTRKDKMVDHLRDVHKLDIPKRTSGKRSP